MAVARRISREDLIAYVNAVLVRGYTKKDAYLEFINKDSKNPSQEVAQMEKRQDYQDVYIGITQSDDHNMQVAIKRVRGKYAVMVEKTIDRTTELLDSAADEKDIGKKSQVIRLATETIGGLNVAGAGATPEQPGKLNKSGVVI